jgi:nuclear transport factor 2 (NTF2) superfamily protein
LSSAEAAHRAFFGHCAILQVRASLESGDAWNSRDPARVALAYTGNSRWRNRSEFFHGRAAIVEFLTRKWANELEFQLIKELWAFPENRISFNMSGAMIPAIGFARTATSNGNSMAMD